MGYFSLASICLIALFCGLCHGFGNAGKKPTVLLVSFDGMRWDYLQRPEAETFAYLAEEGASAKHVLNVFPTLTFPNHYSIVTGLHPETHGIVANSMYDPETNAYFGMTNVETEWWDGGEPIWITAEKQGQVSATYYWPGSESELQGIRPTYWMKYADQTPYGDRIKQVIDWLQMDEDERPTLITLYFDEPDHTAHNDGPDSMAVNKMLSLVDDILAELVAEIENNNLDDFVNLIVTADHGATSTSAERVIFLDDYIDVSLFDLVSSTPLAGIWPKEGLLEKVEAALSNAHPNLHIYRRENVPAEFHYSNNVRIAPLVGVADSGWTIFKYREADPDVLAGQHGYDNKDIAMNPIFLAKGPAFKLDTHVETVNMLDIYQTMCSILSLKPAPHNGTAHNTLSPLLDL